MQPSKKLSTPPIGACRGTLLLATTLLFCIAAWVPQRTFANASIANANDDRSVTTTNTIRGKRIVILADGTWNEPDFEVLGSGRAMPTNIVKVARAIPPRAADGTHQVVVYVYGVGTSGMLDAFTGGAFGDGVEQNVRRLYRFLVYNYESGDEIYLFGFSRGAFTVRTLAGFINYVGLLQKDDDVFSAQLYALYETATPKNSPEWEKVTRIFASRRAAPPIRFIGVWDTVGALGAPGFLGQVLNRGKYLYHDVGLNASIENAFHALAIDEHRKSFTPTLWEKPPGWNGRLEQVWFAGAHSNVGGSYSPDGLANESLHWMVEKAEELGLEFDNRALAHYRPCFDSTLNDSMTFPYQFMGHTTREIGTQPDSDQGVHQSAIDRLKSVELAYEPPNLTAFLEKSPGAVIANTKRVPRTPCNRSQ